MGTIRGVGRYMGLNNNVLVGKGLVSLLSQEVSRFSQGLDFMSDGGNLVGEGEVLILDTVELGSDVLGLSSDVAEVVGQGVVGGFQGVDLSAKSSVGNCNIVQFNSGAVKLGIDVSKSGVQMSNLVGESVIG